MSEWEQLTDGADETYRQPVPGGWIYLVKSYREVADRHWELVTTSTTFVPEVKVDRDGHLLVGQVDECGQIYCPHCDVLATPREVWW